MGALEIAAGLKRGIATRTRIYRSKKIRTPARARAVRRRIPFGAKTALADARTAAGAEPLTYAASFGYNLSVR